MFKSYQFDREIQTQSHKKGKYMFDSENITIKPKELKEVLGKFLEKRIPILITGTPGSGKTSIVQQVAKEKRYDCFISHPSIQSPTDYRGFPVYNVNDDRAVFKPYETLEKLVTTDRPTLFFLDDFGQALPSVQAAVQNLLSSRQVGDHKISDDVVFVLATNDRGQGAHVNGVLSTIKNRCGTIVELKTDPDDWLNWATQNNIRPEVTGFIRLRPDLLSKFEVTNELRNFPSPRSVAKISDDLDMDFSSDNVRFAVIAGSVGAGFAYEFESWLSLYKSMITPQAILRDPKNAEVPKEVSAKIAVTTALAYQVNKENLQAIMTYGERLEPEFRVKMIEYEIMGRHEELKETSEYVNWLIENQKYLN